MPETELQKEIMRAVHKVNDMTVSKGQLQYMGRGEESDEEVVTDTAESKPENIYDQEEVNQSKAVKDIMADILKRSEYINEGEKDLPKLLKQLKKVQSTMGGMSAGLSAHGREKTLKDHLKVLKAADPKLYYKVKSKLDTKGKKGKKASGGKREKKPMSAKQQEWMDLVAKVKAKHPELSRKECMQLASEKRKQ